jgi:transcriptional regulator with XRE-family HTH domain
MRNDIESTCSEKLRNLRRERGLTLAQCESASNGLFKSVVMGSYERGSRAISLSRLQQLADFYEVPIQYFFGPLGKSAENGRTRWVIDLRRLKANTSGDAFIQHISTYLSQVIGKRQDFNGEVISLRSADRENLSLILRAEISDIREGLYLRGLLYGATSTSETNEQQIP